MLPDRAGFRCCRETHRVPECALGNSTHALHHLVMVNTQIQSHAPSSEDLAGLSQPRTVAWRQVAKQHTHGPRVIPDPQLVRGQGLTNQSTPFPNPGGRLRGVHVTQVPAGLAGPRQDPDTLERGGHLLRRWPGWEDVSQELLRVLPLPQSRLAFG